MENREQHRALYAFTNVTKVSKWTKKDDIDDYSSHTKRFANLIQTNGLVAAMTFCKAKAAKDKGFDELYKQISNWLNHDKVKLLDIDYRDDLVKYLVAKNASHVLNLTYESIAICSWLKKMVEALIPET